MIITLEQVTPDPLAAMQQRGEGIWPLSISFESTKHYLISSASGKGKTSLLMFMYGIRDDYRGVISIDGTNLAMVSLQDWSEIRQTKISIVFQNLRLFQELTSLENILLNANLNGVPDVEKIHEMAERLGVLEELKRPCEKLSFGQQQRIAIIRALVQPFSLLFLDEPFSHLDEQNRSIAIELILETVGKNSAGLIITSLGESYPISFDTTLTLT